uniref:CTLH domain-containing protein n=1 Tax=Ascaris lumbricoides TaxID=6252 RepID=A0A0M3HFI6_ASCLU
MNRVNCESLLKQFSIQGNKEALRALVEYVKDDTRVSKAHPHRVLYYSVHLALSLDELNVAKELLELVPNVVHVLATSLRVQLLSRLGCLNEALMQLELVLNEDVPRFDVKSKITDEALDELCAAIKAKPDSVLEMRRFRYLQRLLTKYQRRTMRTVEELLRSTLFSAPKQRFEQENEKLDEGTLEKVLKVAPYILSDS